MCTRQGRLGSWHICPPQLVLPCTPTFTTAVAMPQSSLEVPPHTNYRTIFDSALKAYKNETGDDLSSNPLFHRLETCSSPDDIITVLRQQIPALDQSACGSTDDHLKLTRWLDPTVKVVNAFSLAIRRAVAPVSPTVHEVTSL